MIKRDLVATIVEARDDADLQYKEVTGHYIDPDEGWCQVRDDCEAFPDNDYELHRQMAVYEAVQEIIDQL